MLPLVGDRPSPIYFAAIFGWTMMAVSTAMVAIVRWPLGSPHWFVFAKALLLPGAFIACATLLTVRHVERGGAYGVLLGSMIAVIFLPCLAWLNGLLADVVIYPVFVGLLAAGILQTVSAARAVPASKWIFAVACGCLAGFGYFLVINSRGYGSVLTPEQALTGILQMDTIFHASISNMLMNYGVSSTGIDGLVPIKYHVLSHIWLGCIRLWLGVPTLEAYAIGGQVIGVPMLLFSLSLAIHLFRRSGEGPVNGALMTLGSLLLLFVADLWGWTSYLVSESYFLAMILFLLTLPLLAEIADTERRRHLGLQLALLCVAGLLILLSKISVGAVLACPVGFLLWRRTGWTPLGMLKLAVPLGLLLIVAVVVTSPGTGGVVEALQPFGFLREHPRGAWPNIVANLLLLGTAWLVWQRGALRDRRCAEAAAMMAIASIVPVLLINVPGGSNYYFVNVGTWMAIVFIYAYVGPSVERALPDPRAPVLVVAAILLIALATDEKRKSAYRLGAMLAELQARVRLVTGEGPAAETTTRQRLIALLTPGHQARYALASDMTRTPGARSRETLLGMGMAQAHRAAAFAPPDNRAFWSNAVECRADPLFVPAIIGAPMLKGLNPLNCKREPYYGFADYKDSYSEPLSDQQLCARAAPWKIDTVFILASPDSGRKLSCK
jgi:hypothetical protein